MLKSASADAVAQFMAHRMGVDMDVVARPRAWAAMKGCAVRGEPFVATDMFAALLADTADVLREVVDSLTT